MCGRKEWKRRAGCYSRTEGSRDVCLRDFHLAGSDEGVQGVHVTATGWLVQVGWLGGGGGCLRHTSDGVQDVAAGGFGGVFPPRGLPLKKCCSIQCHSKHVCVGTSKAAGRAGNSGSVRQHRDKGNSRFSPAELKSKLSSSQTFTTLKLKRNVVAFLFFLFLQSRSLLHFEPVKHEHG